MKINIYYGGRGMVDDPTLFVIERMQKVLEELHVTIERYNLHELKGKILTLPNTMKDADGIILASTVEWFGIGGDMHQFLDACWLYGDKEKISKLYMSPIVMSTTYGEREGKLTLSSAWEILGGLPCSGICGYITDSKRLDMNKGYIRIIEKKAENMYRTISQKMPSLPASNKVVKDMVSITSNITLTPQESEQLSQYVADDVYVKQQKEDIEELTGYFKGLLGENKSELKEPFVLEFKNSFTAQAGVYAKYQIKIEEEKQPLIIKVENVAMEVFYGSINDADVEIQAKTNVITEITAGRKTFQRAFMGGSLKVKGDFKVLRTLDQLFPFQEAIIEE
jgi:multimeric flavodoxin WrbA/putative sterol carrier protein